MVARVQLTEKDKNILQQIMEEGWQRPDLDYWTIARLALARSLQMSNAPDPEAYPVLPVQENGIQMHPEQLIGETRQGEDDYSDVYRAMISVYEGKDLFADEAAFHAALQRHVRRGIATLAAEWTPGSDFNRYLLQDMFTEGPENDELAGELGDQVAGIMAEMGVDGRLIQTAQGPRLTRFTFQLTGLDDLSRLKRGEDKLAFGLGLGDRAATVSSAAVERQVWVDIPRPASQWRTIDWGDLEPSLRSKAAEGMSLPVCLGTDVLGAPMLIDLAVAPHLFLGGTTGSGKSMTLHGILLSLLSGRDVPDLLLVDPKAVEFAPYKSLKNLITGEIVTSVGDTLAALNDLIKEMNRRQEEFTELGVRDLAEAREAGSDLKRIVAVIDELGDLFMQSDEIEVPLIRLASKARSAGIHLVLATQRPEAATFPGMLRSNVPSRVALTVQKGSESRIILDDGGAEKLLGRGDMLVKFSGQAAVRAHGPRIQSSDISGAVGDNA
ncbi:FtsK/SpoIIIE domain-containing protein [Devosia aurantiaca]|uniref:DndE family protein n=1 Tax=Devosia aurantiaca TaxID=2714858 RepID=A0A6M1SJ24_9HYPH|nr:FtsK/SpoIIIE domain-containing protein [Devosia aurantiaca]NGP16526.1 DndE family protein [Devosia aurantiaca]